MGVKFGGGRSCLPAMSGSVGHPVMHRSRNHLTTRLARVSLAKNVATLRLRAPNPRSIGGAKVRGITLTVKLTRPGGATIKGLPVALQAKQIKGGHWTTSARVRPPRAARRTGVSVKDRRSSAPTAKPPPQDGGIRQGLPGIGQPEVTRRTPTVWPTKPDGGRGGMQRVRLLLHHRG